MLYKHDEEYLSSVYNDLWRNPDKIKRAGDDLFLGWHFGYYDKDTRSSRQAMHRMNTYVDSLLGLDEGPAAVLDVGCGMGGTALSIAKAHPQAMVSGIALGASEVALARRLQEQQGLRNVSFSQQSFLSTSFPAGSFNVVYALESVSHGADDVAFFAEMRRILKPSGRLIILDIFPRTYHTGFARMIKTRIFHNGEEQSQRTIHSFHQALLDGGFTVSSMTDLNKQRHIKRLLVTTIGLIALDLYTETKRKIQKKTAPTVLLLARFATLYFLCTVSYLTLRFGYFAITAEKTKDFTKKQ
jgi:ubiquinone/menaquinone biosynthesis C-methylase UbiE